MLCLLSLFTGPKLKAGCLLLFPEHGPVVMGFCFTVLVLVNVSLVLCAISFHWTNLSLLAPPPPHHPPLPSPHPPLPFLSSFSFSCLTATVLVLDSESDEDERQQPDKNELQLLVRTLASKLEDLNTCNDLIAKHGSALQKTLSELEQVDDSVEAAGKLKAVNERATLFRITSNAMINVSFVSSVGFVCVCVCVCYTCMYWFVCLSTFDFACCV